MRKTKHRLGRNRKTVRQTEHLLQIREILSIIINSSSCRFSLSIKMMQCRNSALNSRKHLRNELQLHVRVMLSTYATNSKPPATDELMAGVVIITHCLPRIQTLFFTPAYVLNSALTNHAKANP